MPHLKYRHNYSHLQQQIISLKNAPPSLSLPQVTLQLNLVA